LDVDPRHHPHAALIRFLLLVALPLGDIGPFEKTAWEIPFSFQDLDCAIALQKFGLRFYADAEACPSKEKAEHVRDAVLVQIRKGLRLLEVEVLAPLATSQIEAGEVIVENQHHQLRGMYQYFRRQAARRLRPRAQGPRVGAGSMADVLTKVFRDRSEAFSYTVASINSYFSMLEHTLVLLLPFFRFDPAREKLKSLIGSKWSEKYKRIFSIEDDAHAESLYHGLRGVAEEYRNPYAHGGFDKPVSSLYFHVPGYGVFPARLTSLTPSPIVAFLGGDADSEQVWKLFDEVDEWLLKGPARYGLVYIKAGLDVRFDTGFVEQNQRAATSLRAFRRYVRGLAEQADRAANMEG